MTMGSPTLSTRSEVTATAKQEVTEGNDANNDPKMSFLPLETEPEIKIETNGSRCSPNPPSSLLTPSTRNTAVRRVTIDRQTCFPTGEDTTKRGTSKVNDAIEAKSTRDMSVLPVKRDPENGIEPSGFHSKIQRTTTSADLPRDYKTSQTASQTLGGDSNQPFHEELKRTVSSALSDEIVQVRSDEEVLVQSPPMKSGIEQQKVSRPPNGEGMRPVVTPAQEVVLRTSTRPKSSVSAHPENRITERDRLTLASFTLADKSHLQVVTYSQRPALSRHKSNFGEIVHNMLGEVEAGDPTMMRWVCNGEAFTIDPFHPGLGEVLGRFFLHSKYSSFQRQLNTYGWNKCRGGRYNGCFFNPFFRRDRNSSDDLAKIRRKLPPIERLTTEKTRRKLPPIERLTEKKRSVLRGPSENLRPIQPKVSGNDTEALASEPTKSPQREKRKCALPSSKRAGNTKKASRIKRRTAKCAGRNNVGIDCVASKSSTSSGPEEKSLVTLKPLRVSSGLFKIAPPGAPNGVALSEPGMERGVRGNNEIEPKSTFTSPRNRDTSSFKNNGKTAALPSDSSGKVLWGKKALLAGKRPSRAKTRSTVRTAFIDLSNTRPQTPNRLKTNQRFTSFQSFSGSENAWSGSNIVHPLLHPYSASAYNKGSTGAWELGGFLEYDPVLCSPTDLLLEQPLMGPSPIHWRRDGENFFLPIEPQKGPMEADPVGKMKSQASPCKVALTKPTPVRVFFKGQPAQYSPINPFPLTTRAVRTLFEKENEMTPLSQPSDETPVIKNPRRLIMTEVLHTAAAVVSQSKNEISGNESPSKLSSLLVASPSFFVPAPLSGISKHLQSPYCLSQFLGWTSDFSQALDLNECLEDCK